MDLFWLFLGSLPFIILITLYVGNIGSHLLGIELQLQRINRTLEKFNEYYNR